MSLSRFGATEMSLGRLLSEGYLFRVPIHQRDFRWTEDEIEQFFTDIQGALDAQQNEYFIGLMVFMRTDSKEFIILDGQQRIATTVIILASIRKWLKEHDYPKDGNKIQNDYISIRRLGEEALEPRLILNENNNALFDNYVIHEAPIDEIQASLSQLGRWQEL